MPSSSSEARSRFNWFALVLLPLAACATAIDSNPIGSKSVTANGGDDDPSDAGGGNASAGSANAGKSGAAGGAIGSAGNGASGAAARAGAPGGGGKGGAASAGSGSSGASSTAGAGKGGASSTGGAGKGGASSAGASSTGGAGKGAGGASAGGASAGASTGGATGSTTCDAAHSVATLVTSQVYTGHANDCVRLTVNPTWSVIGVKFQTDPETDVYPVPFSFFSCGGNGTGVLSADYESVTLKSGPNPGCDFFVQFEGGATKIKVTYYD